MSEKSDMKPQQPSRRSMLVGASVVSAGAVAAVVAARGPQVTSAVAVETKPAPTHGGGYHLTDHIKHYYATTLV